MNSVAPGRRDHRRRPAGKPDLHVIAVVPRYSDQGGTITGMPGLMSRHDVMGAGAAAGGDRFAGYDLENHHGTPVYVHAKVVVVDDVWAMVGSDNLNRRSWSHDSELSIAVSTISWAAPGVTGFAAGSDRGRL